MYVLIDTYRCLMQNESGQNELDAWGLNRYISLLNAEHRQTVRVARKSLNRYISLLNAEHERRSTFLQHFRS